MQVNPLTSLSIIIPVYNEVDNVERLYREILLAMSVTPYLFEVIFVDDGSTDGTKQLLEKLAQQESFLKRVCHVKNEGQSAAIVTGARVASYPMLVTLDGDGQNDPADIVCLVEAWQDEKTVVFGNRAVRDDHFIRRCSSKIGNGIRRRLLQDDCTDTGCSLKLFPREAFLRLPHFNHVHRFLPALFKRAGYQLINIPVHHRPRLYGVSKYGVMNRLFVGIHDLIGVHWLIKRPCAPEVCKHE